jgi:hypothetical protein
MKPLMTVIASIIMSLIKLSKIVFTIIQTICNTIHIKPPITTKLN